MSRQIHRPTAFERPPAHARHGSRRRHFWMMFACCVPMLAIVIALIATGAVGFDFLIVALLCVVMMPLMHGAMSHGRGGGEGER